MQRGSRGRFFTGTQTRWFRTNMIYRSTFRSRLLSVLKNCGVPARRSEEETTHIADKFFSETDIADSKWYSLWKIDLKWADVCRDLASKSDPASVSVNPVFSVAGLLSWIRHMDYYYIQSFKQTGFSGPFEEPSLTECIRDATVCMAFAQTESSNASYPEEQTAAALLEAANRYSTENGLGSMSRDELRDRVASLNKIGCLETKKGGFRLKEHVKFQAADDD